MPQSCAWCSHKSVAYLTFLSLQRTSRSSAQSFGPVDSQTILWAPNTVNSLMHVDRWILAEKGVFQLNTVLSVVHPLVHMHLRSDLLFLNHVRN